MEDLRSADGEIVGMNLSSFTVRCWQYTEKDIGSSGGLGIDGMFAFIKRRSNTSGGKNREEKQCI